MSHLYMWPNQRFSIISVMGSDESSDHIFTSEVAVVFAAVTFSVTTVAITVFVCQTTAAVAFTYMKINSANN